MLRAIPFVAAALTLTGSFMLEKAGDFRIESVSGNQDIHFVETRNKVKWRDRKSFYWQDVQKDFRTTQAGRVQTLEDAVAKVRLSQSHELVVAPNSLVEIDLKRKSLNLISGKIFINQLPGAKKASSPITVNDQPLPQPKAGEESVALIKPTEAEALQVMAEPIPEISPAPQALPVASVAVIKKEIPPPKPKTPRSELPRKIEVVKVEADTEPESPAKSVEDAPPSLPVAAPAEKKQNEWQKFAGINLPLRSIDILSDNLGKAEGLILAYPGFDASISQTDQTQRLRFDYLWNMLRSKTNDSSVNFHSHDFTGAFIFEIFGLGVSLLGRDILALKDDKLTNYSYLVPTMDLVYSLRTETETREIDGIVFLSPLLYALPLSGQEMDLSGWRIRLQGYFFDKKLWSGYQIGPSLGLFYETISSDYKAGGDNIDYKSNSFGLNVGYSLKF